jgi:GH24 family phage-related lysozyme (muramidase)
MAASAAGQIQPQFSAAPSVSLTLQGFAPETPAPRDGAQVLLAFKDGDIKFSLASMMEILRDHRHEGWVLAAYPDPNTGRPLIGAGFSLDVPAVAHPQRDPLNPHPFIEPSSAELWQAAGLAPDRLQQILAQFDHNVTAWSAKTYRRKIIHHTLTPQLTEEEATQLLRISALQAIYNARAYCPGFDELTGSQQMALSQLVFQMGTNLQQFVHFLDALNDNNNARELAQLDGYMESYPEHWKSVQGTLIDSQWARRYSGRAATVIAMFDPDYSRGPNEAEQRIEATLRPPAPPRPRSHSAATLQVASYSKRSSRTHGKKAHSPQTKRKLT